MDFLTQGISLGRWFRIKVVISWIFIIYAGYEIMADGTRNAPYSGLLMGLLFGTVLVHEFGHALSCRAVGGEAHFIVLTPFGGIAFIQPPMNPWAWFVSTACGPLVNAVLWPAFCLISRMIILHQFGPDGWDYVIDRIAHTDGIYFPGPGFGLPLQICILMWQINKLLLLFNLIPAYPMDGGRILQEILWFIVGYGRSLMIAGMVGTVAGVGFVVIGLGLEAIDISSIGFHLGTKGETQPILAAIGLMCAMQSWGIYQRSHEIKGWRKN